MVLAFRTVLALGILALTAIPIEAQQLSTVEVVKAIIRVQADIVQVQQQAPDGFILLLKGVDVEILNRAIMQLKPVDQKDWNHIQDTRDRFREQISKQVNR